MCFLCTLVDSYDELPLWKATQSKLNAWRGEPGLHYWHASKGLRVIAYQHHSKVYHARACETCGGATKRMDSSRCIKIKCGGPGERTHKCARCKSQAHHTWRGKRLCRLHYCRANPRVACEACGKKPRRQRVGGLYCWDCDHAKKNAPLAQTYR